MGIYNRILLAVDGSDASKNAIKHAIALAKETNGKLTALHVITPFDISDLEAVMSDVLSKGLRREGEQILEDIKRLAESEGVNIQMAMEEGISVDTICEMAKKLDSDAIVMGSHGRTGFGKIMLGSVTERVIARTACPVIVVK